MSKKKLLAVVFVLVFLLAGASVFGFLSWKHKSEMVATPVSFTVNAQGWDVESSSPVPLHVTGKTLDDEKVDVKYFLGGSGKNSGRDLMLKPGSYDVEVYASPINGDGGMYKCSKAVKVSVPKNTDKSKKSKSTAKPQSQPSASASASGDALVSARLDLSPIPANEITDEEIEKAEAAMKEAGLDAAKIKTFTDSARKARQAELDRLEKERKAEEERKAREKKAKEREAMGMYPGAGGPRPANAQAWPLDDKYGAELGAQMGNTVSGNPDMKILMCSEHWGSGVMCSNFSATNYPIRPNGDGIGSSPASTIYVENGVIDYENISGLPVETYVDVPAGQAWYMDNYVLGVTGSGVTVWDTNSGHGFFISNDGMRTETF